MTASEHFNVHCHIAHGSSPTSKHTTHIWLDSPATASKPSRALGREHIENLIDTFVRIQKAIFPVGPVTDYLAKLASERFGVTGIPDGVWHWPLQMGGLELRNPLVLLYGVREAIRKSPQEIPLNDLYLDEYSYIVVKDNV